VARKADAVIVVSQHMKQYLPNQKPIEVLPSGIDFRMFREIPQREARDRLRLPHEERLVLFAGDPDLAGKRYTLAKQAVQLLKSSMEARLVVAWGVPHRDMPLYMNAADALVLTSMAEGSPNVVKEALACNLPVVAVDVGDVAERIAAVEGCKLCGNDRPGTIAKALEDVLRVKQRVSGRRHVSELDEHILTERLIEIYHQVSSE
jgi:glycosyltransferase involved in cell wall biosynthesis